MKMKNRILVTLLKRFDFIIRFVYCKIPGIKKMIPKLFFWEIYKSNSESIMQCFERMHGILSEYGFSFKDKIVMEIGPGNSYLNAYACLQKGAKKAILIDKFPRNIYTKKQIQFCRDEIKFFKSRNNTTSFDYLDEKTCLLNKEKINFISGEFSRIFITEKVDLIFSISVLHLIKNLESYIAKMAEVININGLMYHQIDLKDKFNNTIDSPFLFYKYPDFIWDHFLTNESTSYANRLRYLDYLELFEKYGFKVLWHSIEKNEIGNIKISKKFKGRTDLNIGLLDILLKKEK